MNKTLSIDLSSDRLLAVAADMIDDHNYISALKMLNKNAELNCNDEQSYMMYAEIYDDIGLYEKCVNNWFRYIDNLQTGELADAYEGLAVAYMNLGNEHFSAYYYNKLLLDTQEIDAETRGEIMNSFLDVQENPLKFVYPPKIADCSELISDGIDKMKKGEYSAAIEQFDKIDEENEAFLTARNYIAMCNIICDKCEEAEAECLAVLKRNPDSVQALTTLAAVKTEQKKSEESRELAGRLLELNVTATDDVFKIATVCCENKMHEEAFSLFKKLENELSFDSSVLYFKAVSAFNCGKYEESFSAFDKLTTVYPDAVIARYHYETARSAAENGEQKELSYFYRLPKEEREKSLQMLAAFSELKNSEARKLVRIMDISDCVKWCFDEADNTENGDLKYLGAGCAVKAGLDGLVCDILLNAFLSDGLKISLLVLLGARNEDNCFGVVLCHQYKRVIFRRLDIGRLKRKYFVSAYAGLTAHFAVMDGANGEKFALAAEKLYNKLSLEGKLSYVTDIDALTAALYYLSGVKDPAIPRGKLSEFFDTDEKKISKLLGRE